MSKPKIKTGDFHLVVDARVDFKDSAKLFNDAGTLVRKFPCLTIGTNGPSTKVPSGDTPPGLYHATFVQQSLPTEDLEDVWMPFGEWFIDLHDDDGQEANFGRAGIGIHGGGSNLGANSADRSRPLKQRARALAPVQQLMPTNGCIRVHNQHLEFLAKTASKAIKAGNKFWVTVVQN